MLATEARNMAEDFENHAGDSPPRSTTATILRQLAAAVDDLLADYHTQYDEIERIAVMRGALFEIGQILDRSLVVRDGGAYRLCTGAHTMSRSKLWTPKNQHERDWLRGVRDALALVSEFDKYVAHDYRLSDCILMKLNISNRVRKNLARVAPTKGAE